MKYILTLFSLLLLSCEEPTETSRVGGGDEASAIIITTDDEKVRCRYAKQIEAGGWECFQEGYRPDRWFADGAVKEVKRIEE